MTLSGRLPKTLTITAVAVEMISTLAELTLLGLQWYAADGWLHIGILAADLLLLSPLKAGHAFFYETQIYDAQAASLRRIFRFYRYGYGRSVFWRLQLWLRRLGWYALCGIPSAVLMIVSHRAQRNGDATLSLLSAVLSGAFLIIAFLITETVLLRYRAAVYLLTKGFSARAALSVSARISKKQTAVWARLYLRYAVFCPLFLLIIPYYCIAPHFQSECAAVADRLFCKNSPLICEQHLKQKKKDDKI